MPENPASAGDGPAPFQPPVPQEISDSAWMRGALAACEALLGDCARVAGDREETSTAQMLAAATAAKLAAASALAASAIARLEEAQTHQRLAAAKIELSLRPPPRPAATRRAAPPVQQAYDPDDWRNYRDDEK